MDEIETLLQLMEHCATEERGITSPPRWVSDMRGDKWLVIDHTCTLGESGQYWFWADGTVLQVL